MVESAALKKSKTPFSKLVVLSLLGGIYIALGGLLSLFVAYGSPELTAFAPSVTKLIAGALFPIGLMLIVLVGAELFTGNTMYLVVGARRGVISWRYLLYNWGIVYVGNMVGALLFSYFLVHLTGLVAEEPLRSVVQGIAYGKVSYGWMVVFLKGIGANWLVCLALMLGFSAKDMLGRLVGIWWPVMAFVTLGFEHSVANMFYFPIAMMSGAEVGVWEAIWNNLIPATLGNIVGGGLFVGALYSWMYGEK